MTLEIQNRNLEAQEAVVQDLAAMLCPARTCSGAPVDHWVQLLCQHCQSHPCPLSPSGISGATHQVTGIGVGTAGTDRVTAHWQWGWGLPEGFQCPLPSPWPSHLTSQSFVGWTPFAMSLQPLAAELFSRDLFMSPGSHCLLF